MVYDHCCNTVYIDSTRSRLVSLERTAMLLSSLLVLCVVSGTGFAVREDSDQLCLNGGTRMNGVLACQCPDHVYGERCESPSPCASNAGLCKNGGTCHSFYWDPQFFTCRCAPPYYGLTCEQKCVCQNGGKCISSRYRPYSPRCRCDLAYTGDQCQNASPCVTSNPCQNGGTCVGDEDASQGYRCRCSSDYYGSHCEKTNPCLSSPCENGGSCLFRPYTWRIYECTCKEGFIGRHCQTEDPCTPEKNPCQNGAECMRNGRCSCRGPYYGEYCEKLSKCRTGEFTCLNGGTCHGTGDPFCVCSSAFEGKRCEKKKCPVDFQSCGSFGFWWLKGDYDQCRQRMLPKGKEIGRCLREKYDELLANPSCDCDLNDVQDAISAAHNETIIYNVEMQCTFSNWHADKRRRSKNNTMPSCPARSVKCGKATMGLLMEWKADCTQEERSMKETAQSCISEYLSGELSMVGCSYYEAFFRTYATSIKAQLKLACTGCPLVSVRRKCSSSDTGDAFQEACGDLADENKAEQCMLDAIRANDACANLEDDVMGVWRIHLNMGRQVWGASCEDLQKHVELRNSRWNCPK